MFLQTLRVIALVLILTVMAAPVIAAEKVDVNSASKAELLKLPGVGEATANKIISGRPYRTINDLSHAGVPQSTIEKIKPLAKAGRANAEATPAEKPAPRSGGGAADRSRATHEKPMSEPAPSSQKNTPPSVTPPVSSDTPAGAAEKPPAKGMVWVNTDSGIYHHEGDRWYGKTKSGKYMTEQEARKAGYKAAKK